MNVLALIPARSGSKSIQDKNLRLVAGKPLLAHSIEHALASRLITRTIVSTDSQAYADVASSCGAEVPFLRPADISLDTSTDLEAFTHALDWLLEHEGYTPDLCVHLRPTYPIRDVEDIDCAIRILLERPDIDSVRSVAPAAETPFKIWFRGEDGCLSPVVDTDIRDPHNLPRQVLPATFIQNACIDVTRARVITEDGSMTGSRIYGYLMQHNFDIDTERQLREAEVASVQALGEKEHEKKTFCFDIDGVIAAIEPDNQYDRATPMQDTIDVVNSLHSQGHRIVLFTARGSKTGIDWTDLTRRQMQEWGVRHHELLFGKPAADYYVDDKLIGMEQLKAMAKEQTL
jgi:CMP-N,N'-diacetyllegionaminic acid synthase